MRKLTGLALLCLIVSTSLQAQNDSINVVTTAVPMLRISPDARAGGMGDLGIATTPDANASFWNQAKIPFAAQKSTIGITYTPWLKDLGLNDVYIVTAAGYHQFAEGQAISASLRYFNLGNIQFTDFEGAVMSNLGSKISYTNDARGRDYIPANLGLGVMYHAVIDETSKISFGLDVNKLMVPTPPRERTPEALDAYRNKSVFGSWFSSFGDAPGGFGEELKEFQLSTGMEYAYNDLFFARAGYFYEARTKGNRRFFSAGLGVKYNKLGFNFS